MTDTLAESVCESQARRALSAVLLTAKRATTTRLASGFGHTPGRRQLCGGSRGSRAGGDRARSSSTAGRIRHRDRKK
eukprot:352421-Chlamydomonas_euryale.AAC.64